MHLFNPRTKPKHNNNMCLDCTRRQGGFCQRTCERCSCAPGSGVLCAEVQQTDAMASNGRVHGISRVLFPPPVFTKEEVRVHAWEGIGGACS